MADPIMPIAVVGMSCRFPGEASNVEDFWKLLLEGRSTVTKIPQDRFNIDAYWHPSAARQGGIKVKRGHFLKQDVSRFDAPFFSMTKGEADATDPQQRLLLEVAYEAFENGGVTMSQLAGSRTSVYSSCFVTDYTQISSYDSQYRSLHESTGHSSALVSNRVSWFFDLRGPSMTIDTGCSGSTVAFHLACESLRSGEATSALACGVNLILAPDPFIGMTAFNFVSPDGIAYTFDHRADGYSRGEGFAAVLLKPLDAAIQDGDPIRAVVRSTSVAQDGKTPGLTLPSREAQADLIRHTYRRALLDFAQTAFFEAHGTGTVAGDAAELGAIGDVFAISRQKKLLVGSAKTNIGHLEGCAGLAGIMKAILAVERGVVPANLNYERPRPENDLEEYKIQVPVQRMEWPLPGLRRASVNCFGFGGTIAHIILDEPAVASSLTKAAQSPESPRGVETSTHEVTDAGRKRSQHAMLTPDPENDGWMSRSKRSRTAIDFQDEPTAKYQLCIWSAPEKEAVQRNATATFTYLESIRGRGNAVQNLSNLAYTLSQRRSHFKWRSGSVVSADVAAQRVDLIPRALQASQSCPVAFVFTGQGAQWTLMGRELWQYSPYRESLLTSENIIASLGADWSVLQELKSNTSTMSDPVKSQTLCTTLQIGLVDLLLSWNVTPAAVVGHSSGEIAAAYCAGAVSHEAALKFAYFRGLANAVATQGAMLAAAIDAPSAQDRLEREGIAEAVQVACINSPGSVTFSGDIEGVNILEKSFASEQRFSRRLKVSTAYDSKHMKDPAFHYKSTTQNLPIRDNPFGCRMFSSVSGSEIVGLSAEYFVENLTQPVQFSRAITTMLKSINPGLVLEIGPHAVLHSSIRENCIYEGLPIPKYASMLHRGQDAILTVMEAAGKLWTAGCDPSLLKVNALLGMEGPQCITDLPPYAWNHTRSYWFESERMKTYRQRAHPRNDLLGIEDVGSNDINRCWRNFITPKELPWVKDHRVQDSLLYPAAGMFAMVLEAARQLSTEDVSGYELRDVHIDRAMIIPEKGQGLETSLHLRMGQPGNDEYDFDICSRVGSAPWQRNCKGSLTICHSTSADVQMALLAHNHGPVAGIKPKKLYRKLAAMGMAWGKTFQNIISIQRQESGCSFRLTVPDTATTMPGSFETDHLIHPATFDSVFHPIVFGDLGNGGTPKVPNGVSYIYVSNEKLIHQQGAEMTGHACWSTVDDRTITADIKVAMSADLKPAIIIKGLKCTNIGSAEPVHDGSEQTMCTVNCWKADLDLLNRHELEALIAKDLLAVLELAAHKDPDMAILEIGDGDLTLLRNTTEILAPAGVPPKFGRYSYAYCGADDVQNLQNQINDTTAPSDFYKLDLNDGELDLGKASLGGEQLFDFIVTSERVHNSLNNLSGIANALKPGGKYVVGSKLWAESDLPARCVTNQFLPAKAHVLQGELRHDVVIVCDDRASGLGLLSETVLQQLACQPLLSVKVLSVKEASQAGVTGKIVLMLVEFDQFGVSKWSGEEFNAFKPILLHSRRLLWVTRNGISVQADDTINPGSASILGVLRSLRFEDSSLRPHVLDLTVDNEPASAARHIVRVLRSIMDDDRYDQEYEFGQRGGEILIPRLVPHVDLCNTLSSKQEVARVLGRPLREHLVTDATYVIAGGLGALGMSVAEFLVLHGARHLVFLSRSGASTGESREALHSLRQQGATTVLVRACDISDHSQLHGVIASLDNTWPIRGVIHSAMVLQDQMLENMSFDAFQAALHPKVQGSWNLHSTLPQDLDFFIMLSSIAGVGGMRGQTNYAAGGSYQDGLAQHRRSMGLAATSIDLTVVLETGVVADNPELLDGLHQAGVMSMHEEQVHALVEAAITGAHTGPRTCPPQIVVGVASGGYLDSRNVHDSMWPNDNRFRYTLKYGRDSSASRTLGRATVQLSSILSKAQTFESATQAVQYGIVSKLAAALGVSPDEIDAGRCVSDYGVDSLIAVELRNWIQRQARATVSVFDLMAQTSIQQLSVDIVDSSGLVKSALKASS